MTCDIDSGKIGGFEKYKVESAARTLIEAEEIKVKPEFYAVVLKEVARQAKAAEAVAFETKVRGKLKETFRNTDHSGYGSTGKKK